MCFPPAGAARGPSSSDFRHRAARRAALHAVSCRFVPLRVVRKSPSPIGEDGGRAAGTRNGAFARFSSPGSCPFRHAGLPLRAPVGSIDSLARPPVRLAGRRF
ncbi:hypothetical protein, partial [Burkholderia pseudomallei]|uniref:hypothetical protein n=1 Tax=Burkholderia pseudomallei TaxID=28450 RepID=UPI001F3B5AD1